MADTPRPSGPRRSTGSHPPPAGTDPNDRQALLRAYQDVVQEQKDKQSAPPPPPPAPSKAPFWILMLALVAGASATLVLQPEWLFPRAPAESTAVQEASLRVRMYVEIEHIEEFKAAQGRLPATLLEARGDTTGLRYTPGEGGYSLTGQNGPVSLTYASSQAPREFLGSAYSLISQRSRR